MKYTVLVFCHYAANRSGKWTRVTNTTPVHVEANDDQEAITKACQRLDPAAEADARLSEVVR